MRVAMQATTKAKTRRISPTFCMAISQAVGVWHLGWTALALWIASELIGGIARSGLAH
jgi:hypothetical protein